jgi:2-(1,2-epoxy-1,2-dihydrophenyl)acetyl-CoA isomerase
MALTGDAIDAQEALRIGLVSLLAEPQTLMANALVLAQRIALNSPQILRWTKRLMRAARQGTVSDALDAAGLLQGRAHHTPDHEQAVRAFFEKRLPVFADSGVLE